MQKAMYVKYADTRQDAMSGWGNVCPSGHLGTRTDNDEEKKKKSLSEKDIDSTLVVGLGRRPGGRKGTNS